MSCITGIITIIANDTRSRLSWMNSLTAITLMGRPSLEIVLRAVHQFDEHVFERRRGVLPVQSALLTPGRDRRLQRRLVAAGDVQAGAERRNHVDAGLARELICEQM